MNTGVFSRIYVSTYSFYAKEGRARTTRNEDREPAIRVARPRFARGCKFLKGPAERTPESPFPILSIPDYIPLSILYLSLSLSLPFSLSSPLK